MAPNKFAKKLSEAGGDCWLLHISGAAKAPVRTARRSRYLKKMPSVLKVLLKFQDFGRTPARPGVRPLASRSRRRDTPN
jgi:hypothetical protein